jgi:uncharacterized protein YndB with AHSA1/START domain
MPVVSRTTEIAAPPEKVWGVVSDLSRYPEWNVPHMGFPNGPPELAVGVAFKEKVRILNVAGEVDWILEDVQPERELRMSGKGPMGVAINQVYALEAANGGTTVTATTELVGAAFRPMFKVIEKNATEALEQTLERLGKLSTA